MPDEDDYEYRVRYKRKLRLGESLKTITGYNGPLYSLEDAVTIKKMYKKEGGLVDFFDVGVERRLIMPWEKVRT